MIRISTIFIAICMELVAASLRLTLYAVTGISGSDSAIVALAALTVLVLYNAVPMRLPDRTDGGGQIAHPAPARCPSRSQVKILAAVKNAGEENRIDIYLQPMVTLPQRKVRFYEAVTRLRDDKDQVLAADDFISVAEASGVIGRIDHTVMLKCVQVLRRLMVRNKDVGVFCNVATAPPATPSPFPHTLAFLDPLPPLPPRSS